jgi:GNAT superfamily N-acetyltransferase
MPKLEVSGLQPELKIVRYREPSLKLAELAQPIGLTAWRQRMPHRPEHQHLNVFNPEDPKNAEKLLDRMHSKIGNFVFVTAIIDEEVVGYSWAADDVGNMSPAKQKLKTAAGKLQGKKPFAWVAQINVLPDYQHAGIGSALLHEVVEPFDEDQKPVAYVFDENQLTLNWFRKRAFAARPAEPVDPSPDPEGPDIYFGEGAEHVSQWRLEAQSVEIGARRAASRSYGLTDYNTVDA